MHSMKLLCRARRILTLACVSTGLAAGHLSFAQTAVGGTSSQGPAMAVFGQQLCVAWTGTDSHLWYSCSDSTGTVFTPQEITNQTSSHSPALVEFQGALWIAWTGTNSALNVATIVPSGYPTVTTENFVVGNNDASSQAPALTVANINGVQNLIIAWTGTDSHHHLNVASSSLGEPSSTWSNTVTLNQLSVNGPSLTTFGGNIYIGWAGTDSNHSLNFASSQNGTLTFGAAQQVKANGITYGSSGGPGITTYVNFDYAWMAGGGAVDIAFYSDPTNTSTPPTIGTVPRACFKNRFGLKVNTYA